MFRTLTAILALAALLAIAACNNVTGPAVDPGIQNSADRGSQRTPVQLNSTVDLSPADNEGGGGGGEQTQPSLTVSNPRHGRGSVCPAVDLNPNSKVDLAPGDGEGGGGGEQTQPSLTVSNPRHGRGSLSPAVP